MSRKFIRLIMSVPFLAPKQDAAAPSSQMKRDHIIRLLWRGGAVGYPPTRLLLFGTKEFKIDLHMLHTLSLHCLWYNDLFAKIEKTILWLINKIQMNNIFCSRSCEVEGSVQGQLGQWHLCQAFCRTWTVVSLSTKTHKSEGAHSCCD